MPAIVVLTVDSSAVANATTFSTIADALAAANTTYSGHATVEINVVAGTYSEDVTINRAGVSILGANAGIAHDGARGAETVIDGVIDITVNGDDTVIDGVTVQDGGAVLGQNAGIYVVADNVSISNNIFDHSGAPGNFRAILTPLNSSDGLTVTENSFSGWATGIYFNPGTDNVTVSDNSFDGNNVGMSLDFPVTGAVENNDFANTALEHIGIGSVPGVDPDETVKANTFDDSAAPVTIYGNALTGTANGDTFFAAAGNQVIDGAGGADLIDMTAAGANGAYVDLGSGNAFSSSTGIDTLISFENAKGSAGDDGLFGTAGDNVFYATGGTDVINGREGVDTFDASDTTGNVTVDMETGAVSGAFTATLTSIESIKTGGGDDAVTGSAEDDVIETGAGADVITASGGTDAIDGGAGMDRVIFAGNSDDYTIIWDGNTATVDDGNGNVTTVTNTGELQFLDASVWLVDDESAEYATIQSAVDDAGNGDIILVAEGVYTEQVEINGVVGLTLTATGDVTIEAPADVTQIHLSGSGKAVNSVVGVIDSTDVVLDGFTVDGKGVGNTADGPSGSLIGVSYRNSSGGLNDVDIIGARNPYQGSDTTDDGFPVVPGNQGGVGLQVENDTQMSFFMHNGSISDFQKTGAVIVNADLDVTGVTVTGGGAQPIIAQNGFQIYSSTGRFEGNTISDIGFAGTSNWTATLLILDGNTDLEVVDNTMSGPSSEAASVGIYFLGGAASSGGEISGNGITNVDYGIIVVGDVTPDNILIENNTISDLTSPGGAGVYFSPTSSSTVNYDVDGTAEQDLLQGALGNDTLSGLAGDDLLTGGAGADDLSGGAGDDAFVYDAASDMALGEVVDGGDDHDTVQFNSVTDSDTLILGANVTNVEAVELGGTADLNLDASGVDNGLDITGNEGANEITGTAHADTIDGGDGIDTVVYSDVATMTNDGTNWTASSTAAGADELTNVEIVDDSAGGKTILVGLGGVATIAEALALAGDGDTILLAEGNYDGGFTITQDNLTIKGVGVGTAVIIDGLGEGRNVSVDAEGVTIENLSIQHANYGIEVEDGSHGLTIRDVHISDGSVGVKKPTIATVNDLTIEGGSMSDLNFGVYMPKATVGGRMDGLTIKASDAGDIVFSDIVQRGVYLETGSNVDISGVTMNDVGADAGVKGSGVSFYLLNDEGTDYENISISDFEFTNVGSGGPNSSGISVKVDASASFSGAVMISEGTIDGSMVGVRAGDTGNVGPAVNISEVEVLNPGDASGENLSSATMTVTLSDVGDTWTTTSATTGNINVTGGDGADVISGGAGSNFLSGGVGDDLFLASAGQDFIIGGAGNNRVSYEGSDVGVNVNLATGVNSGGYAQGDLISGVEFVTGSAFDDALTGGAGNDSLDGGAGEDVLSGGAGGDFLTGGAGADIFNFDAISETAKGNNDTITDFEQGTDLIDLSDIDANSKVAGNQVFDFVGAGAHTGEGASLRYIQSNGSTFLYGDVDGDGRGDFVIKIDGIHTLTESDFLASLTDVIEGTAASELLVGTSVANSITGLGGDDTLRGGGDSDILTGGEGADVFEFISADDSSRLGSKNIDLITDFEQGVDVIDLSAIDANTNLADDQAFNFVGTAGHNGDGATLRYIHSGGDTYIYGDVDGDGLGDVAIRLTGIVDLDASDFIL